MQCEFCGQANGSNNQFCTNCGRALAAVTPASAPHKEFSFNKLALIIFAVLAATVILGLILAFTVDVQTGKRTANFILGLLIAIDVLIFIGGFIVGIVFLLEASHSQGQDKHHYNHLATLWMAGPPLAILMIILFYVLFNVLINLLTTTTTQ